MAATAVLAAAYTALGGLRSVAVTGALQFSVMTIAGLIIWVVIWNQVEGFRGIERRLAQHDAQLPAELLHVGHDRLDREDVSNLIPQQIERTTLRTTYSAHGP